MEHSHAPDRDERGILGRLRTPTDRRNFLKRSGGAAAAALLVACDQSPTDPAVTVPAPGALSAASAGQVTINLSNDVGILNFAYALEQLEAAFYSQVVANFYDGATAKEREILSDIKRHEVVHRDFFKAALGSAAIPALTPKFSSIHFDSRSSVLLAAQRFEDLGVGAYNGAAQFLRNGDYLEVAGKIVSVEARHASAIRDVMGVKSFAPRAFDHAYTFETVLAIGGPFVATKIVVTHSPTAGQAQTVSDQEMAS